jgi:hypothetical protein
MAIASVAADRTVIAILRLVMTIFVSFRNAAAGALARCAAVVL